MKDVMQMLAEDRSIDPQFRNSIAGRPTAVPLAMTAHSADSMAMLTEAAEILCGTDAERKLLQSVYNVAVLDGRLEQAKEMLDHIPRELKA